MKAISVVTVISLTNQININNERERERVYDNQITVVLSSTIINVIELHL